MSNPKTNWQSVRKALQPYLAMEPELRARFKEARSRYTKLKKASLAAVVRWEWFSDLFYELDPVYFILGGEDRKPGRHFKKEPASKIGTVHYGFDAEGRVVVEDKFSSTVECREYLPGRIDTSLFHWSKRCINVQSLLLDRDRPKALLRIDDRCMLVRSFEHRDGTIARVLEARFNFTAAYANQWRFCRHTITRQGPGEYLIRWEAEGGTESTSRYRSPDAPRVNTPPPVLDLRNDLKELVPIVGRAAAQFARTQAGRGKKAVQPVSGIGLAFLYYNNPEPEVYINFDTRLKYEPDGTWTHEHWVRIKRPGWGSFWQACDEHNGRGFVIDAHGKRHRFINDEDSDLEPAPWFGQMLVEVLKQARQRHLFKPLSKADKCELGVEDNGDGAFGWPRYEERGRENLVSQ